MTESLPQQYYSEQTDTWALPIMMVAFLYMLMPFMFFMAMINIVMAMIPKEKK